MEEMEEVKKSEVKKTKIAIIKNNLKYRIKGFKGGQSFVPRVGQIISLPEELALKEIESGNARNLLYEEKESLENRKKVKKLKKIKK